MWFDRVLSPSNDRSFFLFGPRGVGKSAWLKKNFQQALYIDLLDSETYLNLNHHAGYLNELLKNHSRNNWVIIDEVQKAPQVLDEVHRLIEDKKIKFILTGSSARKLKRGGSNLLGGRALTLHMEGLTAHELGREFDLQKALLWGTLPLVYVYPDTARETLISYVHTYLKEEIQAEGLLRRVEPFVRFLQIAGMINGQELNISNIARDAKVKRPVVETYISILEDTLLAHKLPSYRPQVKVRESASPKFYWFDPGVARAAAGFLNEEVDTVWLGAALECLLFHELRVYNQCFKKYRDICYYRVANNIEIDFIIETKKRQNTILPHVICIEVKQSNRWKPEWSKHMLNLKRTKGIVVEKMFGVYMGQESLTENEVCILNVKEFLKKLFAGEIY